MFSHGVTMGHRTFGQQVAALEDRYPVIVWDMPYHGRSSAMDRRLRFSTTAAEVAMATVGEPSGQRAGLPAYRWAALWRSKQRTTARTA